MASDELPINTRGMPFEKVAYHRRITQNSHTHSEILFFFPKEENWAET